MLPSLGKCDVRYDRSLSLTTTLLGASYRIMSNQLTHIIGDNQPTPPIVASSEGNLFTGTRSFFTDSRFFEVQAWNYYDVCNFGLLV